MSRTCSYGYDMLSQLTWAMATGVGPYEYVEELFSYKQDGNIDNYECRTKLPGQNPLLNLNTYSYLGDIMTGAAGDNPFALANDNNGNITRLPTTEPNAVNWNWDNKLKNAQKGTSSIAVKYDPMGNRVWRQSTVNGVTTTRKYIIDISGELPTILCEIDTSSGSLKTSYIYADGQILSQRIHDPEDPNIFTPYYYVHDRLGSVRLVIDSEGTAVNSYTYKPYGQFYEGEAIENVANPWKFTGQWYDAEIEQYYLRARQYDPIMMRFTSRDPIRGFKAEPLSLHKYVYCENDSINYVDIFGKSIYEVLIGVYEGAELRNTAVGFTAIGVANGNWNLIVFGGGLQNLVGSVINYYKRFGYTEYRPVIEKKLAGGTGINVVANNLKFNEQQQALIELAKEARNLKKLTLDDAHTLLEWADKYGVLGINDIDATHLVIDGEIRPHIRIGPVNHILLGK